MTALMSSVLHLISAQEVIVLEGIFWIGDFSVFDNPTVLHSRFSFHECRYMLYIFVSSPAVRVRAMDEKCFFMKVRDPGVGECNPFDTFYETSTFFLSFSFIKC